MADRVVKQVRPKAALPILPKALHERRVAAYARVSTDSDEQMDSVEAQKDYFEKLIPEHPGWVLVGIYADEGISGTSMNRREAFNRMIEDALGGKIDLIITKSLSRFARNTVDTLNTIRKLKSAGVGVYFEKEDIDTLDAKGEFLIIVAVCCNLSIKRNSALNGFYNLLINFPKSRHKSSSSVSPSVRSISAACIIPPTAK